MGRPRKPSISGWLKATPAKANPSRVAENRKAAFTAISRPRGTITLADHRCGIAAWDDPGSRWRCARNLRDQRGRPPSSLLRHSGTGMTVNGSRGAQVRNPLLQHLFGSGRPCSSFRAETRPYPAMRTSSVAPVENVPLPARRVSIRLGSGMAVLFSTSKVPAASMFLPCVKFHSARFTCPYVVSVARIWHGARGRLKEHFRCLGDAVEKVGHLLFDRVEAGGMSRRPPPCSKRWVLLRSARRLHDVVEADE